MWTSKVPSCHAGTFAATWSQQGPKGDTGPQGPKGDTGPQGPPGPQGPVTLYDSLNPQGIYSQAFTTDFGDAINLASNPAGAPLDTVTVGMVTCSAGCTDLTNGAPSYTATVKLTIYSLGVGGEPGTQLGSVTDTDITVPAVPVGESQVEFPVTFKFSSDGDDLVLPQSVIYDISTVSVSDASDPTQGGLNIALSPEASAGSNAYPDDVYAATDSAGFDSGLYGSSGSNFGACPGNNMTTANAGTFQAVQVYCPLDSTDGGYDANTESSVCVAMTANPNEPFDMGAYEAQPTCPSPSPDYNYQGTDRMPAVEFTTSSK